MSGDGGSGAEEKPRPSEKEKVCPCVSVMCIASKREMQLINSSRWELVDTFPLCWWKAALLYCVLCQRIVKGLDVRRVKLRIPTDAYLHSLGISRFSFLCSRGCENRMRTIQHLQCWKHPTETVKEFTSLQQCIFSQVSFQSDSTSALCLFFFFALFEFIWLSFIKIV